MTPIKLVLAVLGPILAVALLGIGTIAFDELDPVSTSAARTMVHEYQQIPPLPGATLVRSEATHKRTSALVGASYTAPISYAELRQHYDAALAAAGWQFVGEQPVRIWGQDYGGKIASYCKADMEAALDYAGAEPGTDWNFSLDLVWGQTVRACAS